MKVTYVLGYGRNVWPKKKTIIVKKKKTNAIIHPHSTKVSKFTKLQD